MLFESAASLIPAVSLDLRSQTVLFRAPSHLEEIRIIRILKKKSLQMIVFWGDKKQIEICHYMRYRTYTVQGTVLNLYFYGVLCMLNVNILELIVTPSSSKRISFVLK